MISTSQPRKRSESYFNIARLLAPLRGRRLQKTSARGLQKLFLLILLILLAWVAWPIARVHLQSVVVLDLVGNKPVPWLLRQMVTEPIHMQDLELPLPSGAVRARLYVPSAHPHAPAMVVLHGVHYLGIEEPRLVKFSSAMASCGLRILAPELPDIKDYHIGSNSITTIGESAQWMAHRDGGHQVGVMGLSFSGGLALLAAANPGYRRSIKFVVAVGAHDEMSRVAEFYSTGKDLRPDGKVETLPPNDYGALVLEYEHLDEFVPAPDLVPIRAVLRAHLYENWSGEKAALAQLTLAQVAEANQLMDTHSPATRAELARSNLRHMRDMADVSPHGHLAHLTVPVYLLHGEGDNVVPSAETQWLETELPRATLKATLISPVLSHVNLDGARSTYLDRLRLVHFFASILHAAGAR